MAPINQRANDAYIVKVGKGLTIANLVSVAAFLIGGAYFIGQFTTGVEQQQRGMQDLKIQLETVRREQVQRDEKQDQISKESVSSLTNSINEVAKRVDRLLDRSH